MKIAADNAQKLPARWITWPAIRQRAADYWMMTKPEVNFLVVASSLVGFYLASSGPLRLGLLLNTLLGTLLVASGTATLNEYMERSHDGKMRRTAARPLPAGRIHPLEGLGFGLALSIAGGIYLDLTTNRLACFIALLTLVLYLLLYTPLKRRTPMCTLIGAIPGAMPPLIGWAAARGSLSFEAWILYVILFLWQFPHFSAIAWMYRQDYTRAGYLMLPPSDQKGRFMSTQVIGFSLLLIPVTIMPALMGQAGRIYLVGAVMLGLAFLYFGARLAFSRSNALARRLVLASVVYLPLIYLLMIVNKTST
ncbi:MAG TPA: heme o synthase [Terriglobia bacterium]|nr:heme o synthase [Terriglobia bacterium]